MNPPADIPKDTPDEQPANKRRALAHVEIPFGEWLDGNHAVPHPIVLVSLPLNDFQKASLLLELLRIKPATIDDWKAAQEGFFWNCSRPVIIIDPPPAEDSLHTFHQGILTFHQIDSEGVEQYQRAGAVIPDHAVIACVPTQKQAA